MSISGYVGRFFDEVEKRVKSYLSWMIPAFLTRGNEWFENTHRESEGWGKKVKTREISSSKVWRGKWGKRARK